MTGEETVSARSVWTDRLAFLLLYLSTGVIGTLVRMDTAPVPALDWTMGLALGVLIAKGRDRWPLVFVGAALVQLVTVHSSATLPLAWLAALTVGAGSASAAWLGAWITTRVAEGQGRLDVWLSVSVFTLIAVPVAALMVAGTSLLSGWVIASQSYPQWVAHGLQIASATYLGGLFGTCIVLTMIAEPRSLWVSRLLSLAVPLVAMSLGMLAACHLMARLDRERVMAAVERSAAILADSVQGAFLQSLHNTRTMNDFALATPRLSGEQFSRFAAGQFGLTPGLQALEWVPRIPAEALEAHQTTMAQAMASSYRVTERSSGRALPVDKRAEYFPVAFVYPERGNEAALGYDLGSEPTRRATLDRARRERRPIVTARLRLVQEEGTQYGVLVADPVFGPVTASNEDGLLGFNTAVIRVGQLVGASIRPGDDAGLQYRLDDLNAPPGEQLLSGNTSRVLTGPLRSRHVFEFGGRRWQLSIVPATATFGTTAAPYLWYLYGGCVCLCVLVTAFLLLLTGQTYRIGGIVKERTRDLEESRGNAECLVNLLREAVESIDQGFTIFDERGRLMLSNRTMHRFYALSSDLLVPGTTVAEFVAGALRRGQYMVPIEQRDAWFAWRVAHQRVADGQPFEMQLADGRWLLVAEHKTPSGYTVTNRVDITARRNMEQRQRRSEAFLHSAQRVAHIGSFELTLATQEIRWSDQMYQILGYEPYSAPLTPMEIATRYVHPEDRVRFTSDWAKFLAGQISLEAEYRLLFDSELVRVVHWIVEWVPGFEGAAPLAIGTLHDITDRTQAAADVRRAEQRLAHVGRVSTMGEMATGLAHEVNQPLTAIATYSQAMLRLMDSADGATRDDVREVLSQITAQALRAGDVIRRLRSFVKDHTARMLPTRLDDIIQDLLILAGPDLRLNEILLTVSSMTTDVMVNVDAVQIQQVLLNLIRNAIDATVAVEGRPRHIELTTVLRAPQVEVSVIDHGAGIDPGVAPKLFTQFFTTKQGGTGLGLAISRSIVRAHQGQLDHRDTPGGGAWFYFTLPVTPWVA